jgi:hypothetical protein
MATFRSGFTLWSLVTSAHGLTDQPRVRERVDAVLDIMGGYGGTYGKGRPLVDALEDVAQEALLCGDFSFAQRFQCFAGYARGDLPLEIVLMRYQEAARRSYEEYMRRMTAMAADRAVAVLDVLCRDQPDATAADARDLFRGISQTVDHLELGTADGGTRLNALDARRLQQFGHMEIILRDLPRPASPEATRMVGDILANADAGLLAQLLELRARRAGLEALRAAVDDPESSEKALHTCLENQEWIFGGAYVAELARRQYTPETILDIPLLRGDGSLHVVELKRANIKDLVIRTSGHLMLGAAAHRAVSQAQNYLRAMDESRSAILAKYGVDTRRASATVVIGHSRYVTGDVTPHEVAETLRTYNAHMGRIEVLTYENLLDSAGRMLALSAAHHDSGPAEETTE